MLRNGTWRGSVAGTEYWYSPSAPTRKSRAIQGRDALVLGGRACVPPRRIAREIAVELEELRERVECEVDDRAGLVVSQRMLDRQEREQMRREREWVLASVDDGVPPFELVFLGHVRDRAGRLEEPVPQRQEVHPPVTVVGEVLRQQPRPQGSVASEVFVRRGHWFAPGSPEPPPRNPRAVRTSDTAGARPRTHPASPGYPRRRASASSLPTSTALPSASVSTPAPSLR